MKLPVVTAALLAAACAPSINPRFQVTLDAAVASAKGGHREPAPATFALQPWTVGQWVVFKSVSRSDGPAITRIAVTAQDEEGLWLDSDVQDASHHRELRVKYARMPRTVAEATELVRTYVLLEDGLKREDLDFAAGGSQARRMKPFMRRMAPRISFPDSADGAPREDVTVPAGTFAGTVRAPGWFQLGVVETNVLGWFHPAVPIIGCVQAVSSDGAFSYEVLDYGQTGAGRAADAAPSVTDS